ncbi:MAG: HYR domain-containing protein, partial [Marinirhabdus sp.]
MKKITLSLMALLLTCTTWLASAQTEIPQQDATLTSGAGFVDGDIYTDSGGAAGSYMLNELSTLDLTANAGEAVQVSFTTFDVEASSGNGGQCWDTLAVTGDVGGFDGTYSGDDADAGVNLACMDATDPSGNPTLGPFRSSDGGTLSFTFFSDGSFTQAGWTADINLVAPIDPNAPVINCPMDITANAEPGVCTAVVNFGAPVAVDPNGGSVTVTQTAGPASGSDFPVGDTVVTFMATNDEAPNETTSCSFTVTVVDNQPPMITCPADITVGNDPGICGAVVNFPAPQVMDNCFDGGAGTYDQTINITEPALMGTNSFSFSVPSGMATADATLTVRALGDLDGTAAGGNEEAWTITDEGAGTVGMIGASGDFADQCVTTFTEVFTIPAAMINTWIADGMVDFQGIDVAGNINVAGLCNPPSFLELQLTYDFLDSAAPYTVVSGLPTGSTFPVGTTTQTLEYVDAGGTAVQCSFNITVEDTEAPMVTCVGQPSTVVGTASASPGLPVDDSQGPVSSTITVNDDVEITDLDVDIDVTHTWVGDLTVQLTSPAGTTVTLFDVGCSANDLTFAFDDEGTGDLANCTAGTDSDAYPEASYVPSNPLAAFDGESTAGDWILTVEDTVGGDAGTFNAWGLNYSYLVPGVGITLQLDVNGEVTIPTMDLVDSATDNCGAVTVTAGGAANPCGESNPSDGFTNGGFSDNNPFIAANDFRVPADQDFILEMITANLIADPGATITGVEVRYYEDAGGLPGAQVGAAETVVPTSQTYVTSNFGFDSFETVLPITPMMFNGTPGSETVYWATLIVSSSTGGATGWEGSTTTFMGNDMASSGDNGATWTLTGNGGQDGVYNLAGTCQDIGATATMATFTCDDLGDNLVEVTATDAAGNTSTCLASVTVEDNVAPTLVCQDVTLSLDDNGMLEIEPSDVTMTAEDACGIDSIVTDAATYSCADIGMTFAVTVFAVD